MRDKELKSLRTLKSRTLRVSLGSLSTREYYLKGHGCDRVVPVTRRTPANMKVIPVIFFMH